MAHNPKLYMVKFSGREADLRRLIVALWQKNIPHFTTDCSRRGFVICVFLSCESRRAATYIWRSRVRHPMPTSAARKLDQIPEMVRRWLPLDQRNRHWAYVPQWQNRGERPGWLPAPSLNLY